jgi:hypothetical protein
MTETQRPQPKKIVARLTRRELATIRAALEAWKEEVAEDTGWLAESIFFCKHQPLNSADVDELNFRLQSLSRESRYTRIVRHSAKEQSMWQFHCRVPTYVGELTAEERGPGVDPDFDKPYVPVRVSDAAGIRLILGTDDERDREKPEIVVERRPHGWAIFINSNGDETVGVIFMLDDGRTMLLREPYVDSPISDVDDIPAELDRAERNDELTAES